MKNISEKTRKKILELVDKVIDRALKGLVVPDGFGEKDGFYVSVDDVERKLKTEASF